jgi:hypothetical protein
MMPSGNEFTMNESIAARHPPRTDHPKHYAILKPLSRALVQFHPLMDASPSPIPPPVFRRNSNTQTPYLQSSPEFEQNIKNTLILGTSVHIL